MKFACTRADVTVFEGVRAVGFIPIVRGVRLLTVSGQPLQAAGQERLRPALWDTGGIISVVPPEFTRGLHYEPSGMTRLLRAFDGHADAYPWYQVFIGLPGLPLFRARVVAPEDRDPHRPRRHITLGCDILSRLRLHCESTLPWDINAMPPAESAWTWEYER